LSAGVEGLDPASDALCRAISLQDVTPASSWHQDRLRPPSRQRQRTSPIQSAFHRRRAPSLRACACRTGASPPTSAISTIPEHNLGSPRTPMDAPRGHPRDVLRWDWIPTGQCPDEASLAEHCRVAWPPLWAPRFAPRRPLWGQASRRPSDQGQIRLSPHRSLPSRCTTTNRDTSSMEKRYPNPHGSRTFCRELVDLTAGEAAAPRRFRAFTRAHPSGLAFAKPTTKQPARAGHPAFRAAARFPPRRGLRLAAPKVLSIRGAPRGAGPGPASRDRS